jgi:hypothetical protein
MVLHPAAHFSGERPALNDEVGANRAEKKRVAAELANQAHGSVIVLKR